MNKTPPSVGRILVMVGFALSCFGLLLFLWLAFGGPVPLQPKGYRVHLPFREATQLAQEADVRISGVRVGKVKVIETDGARGVSDATIEIEPRFAPLAADSRAILRQKTLLGETYVELTPGHRDRGALAEGASLPEAQVSDTVELDEILRALDPQTRRQFQEYFQQTAIAGRGRAADISDALGNLEPFAADARRLLALLQEEDPALRAVVRDTGTVFEALSERDGQLRGLIENADRVFDTTARRSAALQDTFRALPTFQREAAATFRRLERFSAATDPLVDQLRPAARELSPTMQDLERLAPDLRALLTDLDPLITASREGLPATERFIDLLPPLLGEVDAPLRQVVPAVRFLGAYTNEIRAFFANSVAASQAVSGSGRNRIHYLRTTNPINIESLATFPSRLPTNRTSPYRHPQELLNLRNGLASFETRHCTGGPVPSLATDALTALGQGALAQQIREFAFGNLPTPPAPPCREQAPFTTNGGTSKYPQLVPSPAG